MSKKSTNTNKYKIISLTRLAEAAKMEYSRLYLFCRGGSVKTNASTSFVSDNEKTQICNALFSELEPVFKDLGFEIKIKRLD